VTLDRKEKKRGRGTKNSINRKGKEQMEQKCGEYSWTPRFTRSQEDSRKWFGLERKRNKKI